MNRIIDIKQTESSPTEPVSLSEIKSQCIVDHSLDDTFLTNLGIQCRKEIENICNISIVDKTIVLTADWEEEKALPYSPIKTITEVKVRIGTASDGTAEYDTLVNDDFTTDGEEYKLFSSSVIGRHKITYTAGMTTVPSDLKKALLNLIAFRYENRGDHEMELSQDVLSQILLFKDFSWA